MGYPPCSYVLPVTLDHIPDELMPNGPRWESSLSRAVARQKRRVVSARGNKYYVDLKSIDAINDSLREKSRENYEKGRLLRNSLVSK